MGPSTYIRWLHSLFMYKEGEDLQMERSLLDEAYRKLKGSVYLDKTLPYIRSEIAIFENENFEHKMG